MITEKSKLMKRPFKKKWSIRKGPWYLFPQRWVWRKSVAEIRHERDQNVYTHDHFWLIYAYNFTWLFINIYWELDTSERLSKTEVRHEPVQHVGASGKMYNH